MLPVNSMLYDITRLAILPDLFVLGNYAYFIRRVCVANDCSSELHLTVVVCYCLPVSVFLTVCLWPGCYYGFPTAASEHTQSERSVTEL